MQGITAWIDRRFYPSHQANWNDSIFRERILSRISRDTVLLDLGAGAGILPQMNFKGLAARVCGVDLDPRVIDNAMLDEGRVADAGRIPYDDGEFDLVFADNVLEHLTAPLEVFREVARVLKPGGRFLFKTPNRRHYVPTIARLTPHAFHEFVGRLRGRAEQDTFPTVYLANTPSDISSLARAVGLVVEYCDLIEGRPEYMRIAWPTYLAGLVFERTVNAVAGFDRFRVLLLGELRKI